MSNPIFLALDVPREIARGGRGQAIPAQDKLQVIADLLLNYSGW